MNNNHNIIILYRYNQNIIILSFSFFRFNNNMTLSIISNKGHGFYLYGLNIIYLLHTLLLFHYIYEIFIYSNNNK